MADETKHILVIEDDVALLTAVSDYLSFEGYDVTSWHYRGPESLDMGKLARPPHIVLSDYHLPGVQSGLDVIGEFRRIYDDDLPAVLFTGDVSAFDGLGDDAGVAVVLKPIRMRDLANQVRTLLKD